MNAAPRENGTANGKLNGSAIVVTPKRPCLNWLYSGDSTHQLDLTLLDLIQELTSTLILLRSVNPSKYERRAQVSPTSSARKET
jgi:hypothetical protein